MPGPDDALLAQLRETAEGTDATRYPVQHATARFHLGSTLLAAGDTEGAVAELSRAVEGFVVDQLPIEHAKARTMLGIALRDRREIDEAAEQFTVAASLFAAAGHRVEEAAATYNRGLVLRDAGREDDAATAIQLALDTFVAADARAQAAAAAHELGACHHARGDLDAARTALVTAGDLARRSGDRAALGAAANVRGVVELAAGDPDAAVIAFLESAGAHPVAVRPAEHAMARSNLALAHLMAGRPAHARLSARQALASMAIPPAPRRQALDVLARAGDGPALTSVLTTSPPTELAGVLRAEFGRLASRPDHLPGHAAEVLAALTELDEPDPLAEAWLDVVLEQPPALFEQALDALVLAVENVAADDPERATMLARTVTTGMGAFHVPQWLRLKDTVAARVEARDGTVPW